MADDIPEITPVDWVPPERPDDEAVQRFLLAAGILQDAQALENEASESPADAAMSPAQAALEGPISTRDWDPTDPPIPADLHDWLPYFLEQYRISKRAFPRDCWMEHTYLVEEALAMWRAWGYYFTAGHPADHLTWLKEVVAFRERVEGVHRGRCADRHVPDSTL